MFQKFIVMFFTGNRLRAKNGKRKKRKPNQIERLVSNKRMYWKFALHSFSLTMYANHIFCVWKSLKSFAQVVAVLTARYLMKSKRMQQYTFMYMRSYMMVKVSHFVVSIVSRYEILMFELFQRMDGWKGCQRGHWQWEYIWYQSGLICLFKYIKRTCKCFCAYVYGRLKCRLKSCCIWLVSCFDQNYLWHLLLQQQFLLLLLFFNCYIYIYICNAHLYTCI